MINWWLIVLAVIIALGVVGLSIYLLLLYLSEEDQEGAWVPKGIVVIGFTLASGAVLLLPFDVASRVDPVTVSQFTTELNTELMWKVVLWAVTVFSIVIVPFAYFYYEAYDPDNESTMSQAMSAAGYTAIFCVTICGLVGILWWQVGNANIPYYNYRVPLQLILNYDAENMLYVQEKSVETLVFQVSIFVYAVAIMCLVGWIFFFVYGGIGLVALPIDIITDFVNRPKAISAAEFARETETVAAKAELLLKAAEELSRGKARGSLSSATKRKINVLRNEVYLLEDHLDRVIYAYEKAGGSPFLVFGTLAVGVIGVCISAAWVMHIFIFNTFDLDPFLNTMLITLDDAFSLLGVIAYAIFSFYLLWCTFKGQVKFGMRVVFFKIHPMKVGDTLLNALLFNVGIILLCCVAVIQFCGNSFSIYANNTAINALLNLYVRRLQGIGTAIAYMQFFFVGVAILSIFWVVFCPRKKQKNLLYKPMAT